MKKALFILCLALTASAYAEIIMLEPLGESYDIKEVDFEEFLMQRAAGVDFEAIIKRDFDAAFKRATTGKEKLPFAPKTAVRRVTPSHTLQNEIFTIDKAGNKKVLYPVGFTYNPLDYVQLYEVYYILNPTRPAEVEWLKQQSMEFAMIIISEGEAISFSETINRPVYVLNEYVKNGLFIKHTPSIAKQEGNQIAIYEYMLQEAVE